MKNVPMTRFKNHFGEYLEIAQQEPVIVEKTGEPVVVVVSYTMFQQAINPESEEYNEEVVKLLRAAAEAEQIVPPQDADAFFTWLNTKD